MEHHASPTDADGDTSSIAAFLRITLELDGDDPAFTNAVSLEMVTALQNEGYQFESVYTGQRSGSLLVEVGMTVAQTFVFVKDHHAAFSEGIQDLGGLVGFFGGIVPLCKQMVQATAKQVLKKVASTEVAMTPPIKITIEIDGNSISVEAPDLEQANAALVLARHFATAHPTTSKQVSPTTSKIKIHGQIASPKRQKRKRRH